MGRTKSKYPQGNFVIKNLPNDKGEVYIYLRYYVINKYASRSTSISIQESDWDKVKQCVKPSNKASVRINNNLKAIREKVDEQIMAYQAGRLTKKVIENMMNGSYVSDNDKFANTDFIEYALNYNKSRYDIGKISFTTYDNGRLNIEAFRKFLNEKTGETFLFLNQLNVDIFNEFINWRINVRGNKSREGINKTLTPLYKAVKYASDNELVSTKIATSIYNNYLEIKTRKYQSEIEDVDVHYLTMAQMQEFVNWYPKVKYDRTRKIMDIFLFAFHACGLRMSDVLTLEWAQVDFKKGEIFKNSFKGNKELHIPLTPSALEILERWKEHGNKRFVFDLLYENFDLNDEEMLKSKRLSKNRTLLQSLHSIGEKMNLPFNLSMHVARHSWAVMALEQKISLHMISKLMGHSSILTTEKVYAKFLPDTVTEEVKSKLSFSFTPNDNTIGD